MADLSLLRPSLATEADLGWYFREAEGALGLRAFNPAGDRGSSDREPVTEGQAHDLQRARRIEERLRTLPGPLIRTLAAGYGPPLPRLGEDAWGWLASPSAPTALVLLIAERRRIGRKELRGWKGAPATKDKAAVARKEAKLTELRGAAALALTQAARAYQEAGRQKRRGPSVEAG